jgi:galactokinase
MSHTSEAKTEMTGPGSHVYRAPGRVNLIGEHTDYNEGFVLPTAIGISTWVTSTRRDDRTVRLFSENFSEWLEFSLDDQDLRARDHWSDYVVGVALAIERAGYRLHGAELRIRGEVPIGSGLSSSAALEVASGYALLRNSGLAVDRRELARLCQQAENEFVGMRCGIMDQFASCHGQAGRALLLDCRSLEHKLLPLPEAARLAVCNTMVKHSLAGSEYNTRRLECEAAVKHFAQHRPEVRALRDVTEADLKQYGSDLPEVIYRRARHVITENARVLAAGAALEGGDLTAFGELMNSSHHSLRADYEVSCRELDLMVALARAVPGVYGARMTGGGFGGCTVNLVKTEAIDEFQRTVARGYEQATGLVPEIYICSAANGVAEVEKGEF